ncbi:hypothetical protein LOTGIDRAFT_234397 [Lottia gigantea]|uniref:Uncharacterized protein n=1 Tax=Lottia gigantea TaxID=225164 RepID=V4A1K7_LOTGI|nr:hypothetical protein LOTGIDRAFT_234397 [Lottia gigantea]ESO88810.1 hypothetical protein LOTGIDRAFT_234397 [Lottia gigantea]
MNMTEELTENVEEVKEVEVKRGRGRPKIPDELKKTKPKAHSGLSRGRPRIHPLKSRFTKNTKKSKVPVLEINIADKAQISLIKDFTNNDLLDTLPVKFVTIPNNVRGRPVKNTISQQIELMVIKPTNGKYGSRSYHVNHNDSDDESFNQTPSTSKAESQSSTSKGRGRPRKNLKVRTSDNSEIYNTPSTSKGRGRPRKPLKRSVPTPIRGISRTPQISYTEYNESDYSDDEGYNYTPSTSKGRGRPRKYPRIDIDGDSEIIIRTPSSPGRGRPRTKVEIEDIADDSNSVSSSESKSKGRGRPRKHTKKTISTSSSPSKGRGRPRKHPMTAVSDIESDINDSPSTSKGRGRPRKYPKIDTPIEDKPKKVRGRPRKSLPSEATETMILTVGDDEATIEHILTDNHVGSSKQKLGRGRPKKEAKVILETSNNGEGNTEFECQINSSEIYSKDSGVQEENVLLLDDSNNCEEIEYSISEQTAIPLEDVTSEPVSEIIS